MLDYKNMKKNYKILVADDDPAILDAIGLILEDEGYNVVKTSDGETIPKMKAELPAVLLLDIWMSGQDGREICRVLKNQSETRDIPVILISASRDIQNSAKEAGADDFLAKPFQMDDLLRMVEKHLGKS